MLAQYIAATFWYTLAAIFACVEIESEGRYGWAEKTPTWYRTTGIVAAVYGAMMGKKPLTGYHLFMFFIPIMIFHIPLVCGVKWSGSWELNSWAMYFAWCPLWDFIWFVLNPHYGIKKFKKKFIWWHAKSIWVLGIVPLDYVLGVALSLIFAYLAMIAGDPNAFAAHLHLLCVYGALTSFTIALAPFYHGWYVAMRKHDDRDKAGIFHHPATETIVRTEVPLQQAA